METINEEAIDTLESLEQRVQRAVEVLNALRSENHELSQQLAAAKDETERFRGELEQARQQLSESDSQLKQLTDDVAHLRDERKHVKSRIEKLLGQMDLLGAS